MAPPLPARPQGFSRTYSSERSGVFVLRAGLGKHLKRVPGVAGVTTLLEKEKIVVHIEDPQKVTEDQLRKAVENAGFTARAIRIEKGGADHPAEAKPSGGRK